MSNGMYKAGVIGDRETVMGFRALGLTTMVAENEQDATVAVHSLAREKHAVIYITEQLAALIPNMLAGFTDDPQCAIIPIPSKEGSLGIGLGEMHRAVERAVGADILKEKES